LNNSVKSVTRAFAVFFMWMKVRYLCYLESHLVLYVKERARYGHLMIG